MTEIMQDSGVEWIGAIPNGWKLDRLKDKITLVVGGDWGDDPESEAEGENIIVLRVADIEDRYFKSDNLTFRKIKTSSLKNRLVNERTILLEKSGGGEKQLVGRAALPKNFLSIAICSNFMAKIDFQKSVDIEFANYLLFSLYFQNLNYPHIQQTTGIQNLNVTYYLTTKVLFPPIPEQQAIAQYLDERCGKLDSIIAIKKQQIQTLDALRQSIIYQAVTKGLDDSVELVDSGVEWLGEIPKGWKVDKLKRISDIRYGLGQPPASKDDGLPMIRATDVYRGTIIGDKLLTIDPDTLPLGRNPYLKEDEIIVVRSGAYTGDSAIIPAQYAGAIAGYDMVVTVNRANPKFIAYCLLCDYVLERQLRLLMLRAAQPHLNSQELGGILLVLPKSNEDQQKIVDYLDDETQRLAQLKANLTQQINVLLDYKKSLIYECVTGKKKLF